jgi:cytidylate kinase
MTIPRLIAIDGTAASGKSTLGKRLADTLGYLFFDTGMMYRALTWIAIISDIPIDDETRIASLAETTLIDVQPPTINDGRSCDILVGEQDITWETRRPEVDANVSIVSAYPGVRQALTAQQQRIGERGNVVMVGRDIGTVVLPSADLKIFLEASIAERAKRRFGELRLRGEPAEIDEIKNSLVARDQIDSNREVAPLRAADDAIRINTDNLDADQVFQKALRLVHQMDKPDEQR